MTIVCLALCVSTTGVSPVTVIVSVDTADTQLDAQLARTLIEGEVVPRSRESCEHCRHGHAAGRQVREHEAPVAVGDGLSRRLR